MLALHFGSCLGCVEPVLLEWSVPCPGGSVRAQWERYFFRFRGLFRELWACYRADAFNMAFFGVLFVSGGRVILSSIRDEVILCGG